MAAVDEVKRQIGNRNPVEVLNEMCMQDTEVRNFVHSVRNLSPMQLAAKYFGIK